MKKLLLILLLPTVSLAGSGFDRLNEETQLPFWRLNILSGDPNELEEYFIVLIESLQDLTDDIITDLNQLTSVESGITAVTTGEQGDKVLTAQINEISTVANANDAVTLPQAISGRTVEIINNGDNLLEIWPFKDDDAGGGVDTAIGLASGNNLQLTAYDSINWEKSVIVDGEPDGSNTEVQYNNGGLFGGDSTFTFNDATKKLIVQIFESIGVSILGDGSLLKTSAAPTTDAMIVNKKYVDDIAISGAPPGGANTNVQYNDSSAFGGDSTFTFNKTTKILDLDGQTITGTTAIGLDMSGGTFATASIKLPGSTIQSTGDIAFQPTADSTTAFQWKDQDGGTPVLNIDTTNERVGIGTDSPNNKLQVVNLINFDDTNGNVFLGTDVFNNDVGKNNIGIGFEAGKNNSTTGAGIEGEWNTYIGFQAGIGDSGGNTGYQSVALGALTLRNNTSGFRNFACGYSSLEMNTSGRLNTGLGFKAVEENTTGFYNTGIGASSLSQNQTGNDNVGIGRFAGAGISGNSYSRNTFIGSYSTQLVTTGSGYICLGYKSGYNQTDLGDRLIIDNQDRGSAAAEITDCLIYGVMSATPSNQTLRLNIGDFIQGNPVHSDADGGGAMVHSWIREDGAGTPTTAATLTVSHDGTGANDQLAKMVLGVNTGAGVVDVIKIDSNAATFIGDAGVTNYTQFESDGSPVLVGTAAMVHAEIYVQDNATPTTITSSGKANKVQIVIFNTDGSSKNMTPDHANDHITVVKAGMYMATVSITVSGTGGDADNFGFSMWKNDGAAEFVNVHGHRNLSGGAGDIGSVHLSGIVDLAVDDTIEMWMWNEDDTDNATVDDITLSLIQIGGT